MAIPVLAVTPRSTQAVSGLTIPALAGFGLATTLHGIAPLCTHNAHLLVPGFLACAGLQTIAGLLEWRRQQPLVATMLVAYALFWCSQLPQLLHPAAGPLGHTTAMAGVGYLSLWGVFAFMLAGHAGQRALAPALYGLSATLLLQAGAVVTDSNALIWAAAAGGLFSGCCAILAAVANRERNS